MKGYKGESKPTVSRSTSQNLCESVPLPNKSKCDTPPCRTILEIDMSTYKSLLVKAFAMDSIPRLGDCVKDVCHGCIFDCPSQRDHDVCLEDIVEQYRLSFHELSKRIDQQNVSTLFKDYIVQMGLSITSAPKHFLDEDIRMTLFDGEWDFLDLIISYVITSNPVPPTNPTLKRKRGDSELECADL